MSKTTKVLIGVIVSAIIIIGVGYALSVIELTITGTAEANPADSNFIVFFDESVEPTTDVLNTATKVEADITGEQTATIKITELQKYDDWAEATYTITNDSPVSLDATLTAEVSGVDTSKYEVNTNFGTTVLKPGNSTTLTVRATLKNISLSTDEGANKTDINVKITATPTQN